MATTNIINSRLMVATKTAAQWTGYSVVPLKGELCFESDTLKFKLGDGASMYDALPYASAAAIAAVAIDGSTVFTATRDDNVLNVAGSNHITVTYEAGTLLVRGDFGDIVAHSWAEVSNAISNAINALDSSVSAAPGKVLTGVTQTDGRLTGKTEVGYATIAPVRSVSGSGKISVSPSAGVVVVTHNGSAPAVTADTTPAGPGDSVVVTVSADGTGHVTDIKSRPLTNMVTGAGLTAGQVILGNGGTAVKASGKTVATSVTATNAAIPTSAAVKAYVDGLLQHLSGALTYKGTIGSSGATVTALPATHSVGDVYVAATDGTYAGKTCEVGDTIICVTAGTAANDAHWTVVTGENQVSNLDPALAMNGAQYKIANVDGTDITLKTPSLNLTTVGGAGKMIQSVSQVNGKVAAVAVDAPVNTDNTAITNGTTTVKKSSGTGITVAGGTNKITFSDGTTTFDIPISISVTHPAAYSRVSTPAQSTSEADAPGNAAAVNVDALRSGDAVTVASANKWVTVKGDKAAKTITVGHSAPAIANGGSLLKISVDKAGHVVAKSAVAASEVTVATAPASTAASGNDSTLKVSVGGVAGVAAVQPIYTDLLKNGNLTLVLNGNF